MRFVLALLLRLLTSRFRPNAEEIEIELLVAKQRLAIYQRSVRRPRLRFRDRDGIYGDVFRGRVEALGIEEVLIAPRSPWQSPFVELAIGGKRATNLHRDSSGKSPRWGRTGRAGRSKPPGLRENQPSSHYTSFDSRRGPWSRFRNAWFAAARSLS